MNFLYICQNALGDIVTSLPSIHFLKEKFPTSTLDILVNETFVEVFAADPNIDRVICHPANWFDTDVSDKDIGNINGLRSHYDIVIDSMCIDTTARLVMFLRPIKAIGIGFAEALHAYNLPLPLTKWKAWSNGDRTVVDCLGDFVELLNVEFKGGEPVLYISSQAQREGEDWINSINHEGNLVVAINPGAGNPAKCWPMEYYLEIAWTLCDEGIKPLFIFGPNETQLFSRYGEEIKQRGGYVYQSECSRIQLLAGILCKCSLLLSNDCAVMHVGAAIGCRVLAIFGPTNSRIWFPYRYPWNQVIEHDYRCRYTCRNGCESLDCLKDISPQEVLIRLRKMLPRTSA